MRWEAATELEITLPRTAGGVPSIGVNVQYQLEDDLGNIIVDALGVEQSNLTTTQKDGKALLSFAFVPASALTEQIFNLRVAVSKLTTAASGDIPHEFLCDGGAIPCSPQGNMYTLQNLVFDKRIQVIDNTTVPVQGRVLIGDSGCPLQGANVCVNAKSGTQEVSSSCVETDFQGDFAVGAVIGTFSTIAVTLQNHTFEITSGAIEVLQGNGKNGEGTGFLVEATKDYSGLVFADTTTTTITVDVVGGLCNRHLGSSTVKYRIRGCSTFEQVFPSQIQTRGEYTVYSHPVEVSAEVYGIQELESQVVDLTEEGSATASIENVTDLGIKYFRFQFDGSIAVSISSTSIAVPRCGNVFSLLSGSLARVTIRVRESFPPRHVLGGAVADCTLFPEDARIIVTNKLGVDLDDPEDAAFFADIKAKGAPQQVQQMLQLCSSPDQDTFCSQSLIYDNTIIAPGVLGDVNGRVEFPVLVGPPNTVSPFTKRFTVEFRRTVGALGVPGTVDVIVVGDYDRGLVEVVDLPVYEPVMILRDPPGGNSFVSYENMETTIEVVHDQYSRKSSTGTRNHSFFGLGVMSEVCTDYPFVSVCGQAHSTVQRETAGNSDNFIFDPVSYKDNLNTVSLSTTWSYTTSRNPWTAGQASDVFVVPSLKLALESVDEISLDAACAAQIQRLTKFSGAEELALTFLTYNDVISFHFNDTLVGLQAALAAETSPSGQQNIRDAIDKTKLAIESWDTVISDYIKVNEDAAAGLNVVKPYEWFSNFSRASGFETEHFSGLLPKSLIESAVPLPNTDESQVDLQAIDVITFTGGGSSIGFTLRQEESSQRGKLQGENSDFADEKFVEFGGTYFPVLYQIVASAGTSTKTKISKRKTKHATSSSKAAIHFHLGDSNAGDRFDVQIALDPKYETFIFTTQSTSRSKCPHEPGTVNRENTRLEVLPTSASVPVLPNEPMVFHLRMTNTGEEESVFQLAVDQKTNPHGLTFNLDSEVVPITFLPAKASVDFLLEVRRGPVRYEYPPLNVSFRSGCEFDQHNLNNDNFPSAAVIQRTQTVERLFNDAATGKIVFAQPCPSVSIAKPDPRSASVINLASGSTLTVIVRNPGKSTVGSFAEQVLASRLQAVKLKYRSVSRKDQVFSALSTPIDDLDFAVASAEDALGFSAVSWDIEVNGLLDGVYEVWAEAECDPLLGAPPGFNSATSAVLRLTVDRRPPKLFLQDPAGGQLSIGQPVRFAFTEDIECRNFKVEAEVEGVSQGFDNDVRDNVLLSCDGKEISFQFDPLFVDYSDLLGKKFGIVMTSLQDLNGNELGAAVVANLTFATLNLDKVGVEFDVVLQRNCSISALELQIEIASAIGVEADRINVKSISCVIPTGVVATVEILPDASTNSSSSGRRLAVKKLAPLQLLYEFAGKGKQSKRRLQSLSSIDQLPGYVGIRGVHINDPNSAPSNTVYLETDQTKLSAVEEEVQKVSTLSAQRAQQVEDLKQIMFAALGVVGLAVLALVLVVVHLSVKMRLSKSSVPVQALNYSQPTSVESINPTYQEKDAI